MDERARTGRASIRTRLLDPAPTVSFEFFPPRTDAGEQALWQALRELEPLRPGFVSVTYGAGGSTRDRTVRVTRRIAEETTLTPMAHLTCVGSSRAELASVLGEYADAGIHSVLALRGDPPGGPGASFEQAVRVEQQERVTVILENHFIGDGIGFFGTKRKSDRRTSRPVEHG